MIPKLNNPALTIQNPSGYKVLLCLGMLYLSILLCNIILTNRYVGIDQLYILGGTLTSPFTFILDDIVAEIYGYRITRFMIVCCFLAQLVFVLICQLVVMAPHPSFFTVTAEAAYTSILGPSLLRLTTSGFLAYIIANLINSYILTRWKVLLKGRKFWLRSLASSTFSEALYTFIAILLMEIQSIPLNNIFKIILVSYLIKAIYSIVFAGPAHFLVAYLKKLTQIDVFDFPKKLTPFKYRPEQS